MELAITKDFTEGKLVFKNAALRTATQNIVKNMQNARKGFVAAGMELKRIRDDKLYEKDFIGNDGKPSFAIYVDSVLGISKTTAYRIIKTTEKLLAPEMLDNKKPKFFENFSDGTLDVLSGFDTYEDAIGFCNAYQITEITPREDVRRYMKAYVKQKIATLEDYIKENDKPKEIETVGEVKEDDNTEKATEVNNAVTEALEYLNMIADFFKADLNSALDLCSSKEEEILIKTIAKKYGTK